VKHGTEPKLTVDGHADEEICLPDRTESLPDIAWPVHRPWKTLASEFDWNTFPELTYIRPFIRRQWQSVGPAGQHLTDLVRLLYRNGFGLLEHL
jgi:hypothetical protein